MSIIGIKALVVDNNPVLLKAVSSILEQEGCHVLTAENGLEAIEIAKKEYPDIIFTDLIMPLVGGEKLCKVIRSTEDLQDTFLVILSAVILEERERILEEIDCDVCIAKGSLRDLRIHLQEAIDLYHKSESVPGRILGDSSQISGDDQDVSNVAKELLSQKYHLKEMLANLSEGIVELNQDGKIVSINNAAGKIIREKKENLIGRLIDDIMWESHSDDIKSWVDDDLVNKRGNVLDIEDKDPLIFGDSILTAYFLPVIKDGKHFAICILRDITRQYIAEKRKFELDNAIRLVKKMDAMSCMAGGVAHDFNNLLTVICGNLDMINVQGDNVDLNEIENLIQSAREAAYVTVELVRKISCFSPFGIVHREDIDINSFLEDFIISHGKGSDYPPLKLKTSEEKIVVNIDSQQISKAIANVLKNSEEAGSQDAISITIENELLQDPVIRAGQYVAAGNYAKLQFADKGKGIESENLLEVFDPYYSTKQRGANKGMGLGLTIVYSTLRNHGGYVVMESTVGQGTRVTFYLPLFKNILRGIQSENGEQEKILLVEDDEQLRSISKIMLEFLNYTVFEAQNEEESMEVFSENNDAESPISYAILNLSGSGYRVGVEICQALHNIDPSIKVLVSSGSLLDPVMRKYKEYGFSGTLQKPYTMDDLRNALSTL